MNSLDIERICHKMKLKALEMANKTSFGAHIGGGFSAMELLATLYSVAHIPSTKDNSRDRIIVSKGHCVLAYYTALWSFNFISDEDLSSFETDGTSFYGHPHRDLEKGIEFSGGSLGLGVSYAVGVALACKRNCLDNTVYVLIGDGEMNEGIVWEALMSMSHFRLNNIVLIIDRNKYQLDGTTSEVMDSNPLESKLSAFGFEVLSVNGHSIDDLLAVYNRPRSEKPRAIIADTIKAHGISFLENTKLSHQCLLPKKKYDLAVEEINKAYAGK